jgi:hypothetical protein
MPLLPAASTCVGSGLSTQNTRIALYGPVRWNRRRAQIGAERCCPSIVLCTVRALPDLPPSRRLERKVTETIQSRSERDMPGLVSRPVSVGWIWTGSTPRQRRPSTAARCAPSARCARRVGCSRWPTANRGASGAGSIQTSALPSPKPTGIRRRERYPRTARTPATPSTDARVHRAGTPTRSTNEPAANGHDVTNDDAPVPGNQPSQAPNAASTGHSSRLRTSRTAPTARLAVATAAMPSR